MITLIHKQMMREDAVAVSREPSDAVAQMYWSHRQLAQEVSRSHRDGYTQLLARLDQKGVPYVSRSLDSGLCAGSSEQSAGRSSRLPPLWISFGGDGTFLQVAAAIHDAEAMVLGMKSTPCSVGALCVAHTENIDQMLTHYLEGTFRRRRISRLSGRITSLHDGSVRQTPPAVNDLLFTHSQAGSAVRYMWVWNEQAHKHISSGIWIYTALGAAAAAAAAGATGLESTAADEHITGFVIRELYGSLPWDEGGWSEALTRGTKTHQGVFVADEYTPGVPAPAAGPILVNLSHQAQLVVDGRHSIPLSQGDRISFVRGQQLSLFACN